MPNVEGLAKLLKLIKIMSNHDEQVCNFILDWIAHMFQYPEIKIGLVIVLVEKQGIGKGTLILMLTSLLASRRH